MKQHNGVVGFVASAFDLLHAGHIVMLEEAKRHCDYLIAGLQNDPTIDRPEKNKPVQSIVERQLQVGAVRHVDEVIVYNTEADLRDLLLTLPIDVRIIGEEYEDRHFTGKDIPMRIVYNSRKHSFSSTDLRKRVKEVKEI
jgi:glycerol-3-phosphate cytidylyltransferase